MAPIPSFTDSNQLLRNDRGISNSVTVSPLIACSLVVLRFWALSVSYFVSQDTSLSTLVSMVENTTMDPTPSFTDSNQLLTDETAIFDCVAVSPLIAHLLIVLRVWAPSVSFSGHLSLRGPCITKHSIPAAIRPPLGNTNRNPVDPTPLRCTSNDSRPLFRARKYP